ncbi:hypothetical protein INT80_15405 [Gallibacterium anatis]|uniref:Uncharacterized protein n=1 Tax=Gallibacterium anatis TaxID=750 RepID=A0A930UUV0_9PAST|nr:hypothetical protein [Gallibacterium anatis]
MKDKSVEELVAALLGMLTGFFADDILIGSSPPHDETTATDICTGLSALTIADAYGLKIEECFEYAYDQIKDRKGRMVDGIFVMKLTYDERP